MKKGLRWEFVPNVAVKGAGRFVVKDHFRVGNENSEVALLGFGPNFQNWYLHEEELNVPSVELAIQDLTGASSDLPLSQKFSYPVRFPCTYLWRMLEPQGSGEEGDLSLKHLNLIYNSRGVLFAHWIEHREGWFVGANSIEDRIQRQPGTRIISLAL